MPTYFYTAVDATGRRRTGRLMVSAEPELEERLRRQGLWLIDARAEVKPEEAESARRRIRIRSTARRRELIHFCTMMTFMLEAGITLVDAIEHVSADCDHPGFRQALLSVRHDLESGHTLHEAMASYPGVFPPNMVSLVRAGESSGALPETFSELRKYYEWVDSTIAEVRQATLYPAVVLSLVIALVTVLFSVVIPKFQGLLASTNAPLPGITRFVFGLGEFMSSFWWLVVLVFVGAPFSLGLLARRSPAVAYFLDRLRLRLPLFGSLFHMLACARYAHILGLLYRSGINLLSALELCSPLVGSPVMEKSVEEVRADVEGGDSLSEAMQAQPVFPSLLVRMVSIGERSGSLDRALDNVARYYDLVAPRRLKRIISVVEPLLIITLVGIVGLVALSIFLPLISLMGAIR